MTSRSNRFDGFDTCRMGTDAIIYNSRTIRGMNSQSWSYWTPQDEKTMEERR